MGNECEKFTFEGTVESVVMAASSLCRYKPSDIEMSGDIEFAEIVKKARKVIIIAMDRYLRTMENERRKEVTN